MLIYTIAICENKFRKGSLELLMEQTDRQTKSKERVRDHGEVFTSEREVNAMLDLVKNETERIESRFLEPACGTGNFLIKILERKLDVVDAVYRRAQYDWETHAFLAVSSIYGVELLPDNTAECRERLLACLKGRYARIFKGKTRQKFLDSIHFLLQKNIICGDALTLLTADGKPIVFSEWSFVSGGKVQRRDFSMSNLLESKSGKDDFFSQFPELRLPVALGTFPAVHFLEIKKYDTKNS